MHEGIYVAASGAIKQIKSLEVTANNLANANSAGFKKDSLVFQELITPFKDNLGFEDSRSVLLSAQQSNRNVAYVGISGFYTDHSQGTFLKTGNTFDLALDGDGYFKIKTPQGTRYTRNGSFRLDANNRLVTQTGNPVLGVDGEPVVIDSSGGEITIDKAGGISAGTGLGNISVGNIKLVQFRNSEVLKKEGAALFSLKNPAEKEQIANQLFVRQGFVETSNVNSIREMGRMMMTLRAFEAYQRVIRAIDGVDEIAANNLGRVA